MSDTRMNKILASQKSRRIVDLAVGMSLFGALFYTTVSLFA
jgi:hypothetical protein